LGEPAEVDRREQLEGAVTLLMAAPASAQHRDLDVVEGAEVREQVVQLEHEPDLLAPVAVGVVQRGEVMTLDTQCPRLRPASSTPAAVARTLCVTIPSATTAMTPIAMAMAVSTERAFLDHTLCVISHRNDMCPGRVVTSTPAPGGR
jgi:hypothetical protein